MKRIAFVGGGTAGHIMPNLALIAELRGEFDCVYLGGELGMEKSLCAARAIRFYEMPSVKLRRGSVIKNLSVPFKLNGCVRKAKRLLEEIKPDLIFSKGGYAALPAVLAAKPLKIKLLAHESDLTAGIVTKMSHAHRRADKILCAFETCAASFSNGVFVGAPLDKGIYRAKAVGEKARALASLGLSGKRPVLLVMGGSSGAKAINDALYGALETLLLDFDIIHITGKNKSVTDDRIHCGAAARGYRAIEFSYDMPTLYAAADYCITRAGANALSELIALGIPALAVPLEKASRGDQIENARRFSGIGAIEVLYERDLSPDALDIAVKALRTNRQKLIAAMKGIKIDGRDRICDIIRDELK